VEIQTGCLNNLAVTLSDRKGKSPGDIIMNDIMAWILHGSMSRAENHATADIVEVLAEQRQDRGKTWASGSILGALWLRLSPVDRLFLRHDQIVATFGNIPGNLIIGDGSVVREVCSRSALVLAKKDAPSHAARASASSSSYHSISFVRLRSD
jgi:hypothetical protein